MEKKCFKCNVIKSLEDFYSHPQMPDGKVNKCKSCNKKDSLENYNIKKQDLIFIEKERKRGRDKYYKYNYKSKSDNNRNKIYNLKFPEKFKAKSILGSKLKIDGFHRHHWSYNEEHYCDIIYLTIKEHNKAHRFLIYDSEYFKYRRCDNLKLLLTKEDHIEYIKFCIQNHED
jgi:hypothetical protein